MTLLKTLGSFIVLSTVAVAMEQADKNEGMNLPHEQNRPANFDEEKEEIAVSFKTGSAKNAGKIWASGRFV